MTSERVAARLRGFQPPVGPSGNEKAPVRLAGHWLCCMLLVTLVLAAGRARAEPAVDVPSSRAPSAGQRPFSLPLPDKVAQPAQSFVWGILNCGEVLGDARSCLGSLVPALPAEAEWMLCGGLVCATAAGAGTLYQQGNEKESVLLMAQSVVVGMVLGATVGTELARRHQPDDELAWSVLGAGVGIAMPVAVAATAWLVTGGAARSAPPPRDSQSERRRSPRRARAP